MATKLDTNTEAPAHVAPGDAPADTTDPTERASSAPVAPNDEARRVGTVNAVLPMPEPAVVEDEDREDRIEEYDAIAPNGDRLRVRHNIDTGDSEVVGADA